MNKRIVDVFTLILGNLILAFGVGFFIIPNKILSGGVAGVSIAISPLLNISVPILINIIIFVCFVLGLLFIGKEFAIKTVASSLLYPLFLNVLSQFDLSFAVDPLIASVYGGLISGVGLGITFRSGASTGGMDIPPLILQKFTGVRVSIWILILDAMTVMLGFKTYGMNAVLIGLISVFACTFAIDKMQLLGGEVAKQVLIITSFKEQVLEYIHTDINRGSTIIPAMGGYTGDGKEMIMTVLMREQYVQLEKAVKQIDQDAFLIVSEVTEVHGKGFYRI